MRLRLSRPEATLLLTSHRRCRAGAYVRAPGLTLASWHCMRWRTSTAVALVVGAAVGVLVTAFGWLCVQPLWQQAARRSPHERYTQSLVDAGLSRTGLGTEWLA